MKITTSAPVMLVLGLVAGMILSRSDRPERLPTLGATALVTETQTGLLLAARVDTGAEVTSVHCQVDAIDIAGVADDPRDNVGKQATLQLAGRGGQVGELTTRIEGLLRVRNADHAEDRYQVRLRLRVEGVERDALVTLNDRSAMRYPLLLGRDFLRGAFVVDVDRDNDQPR